MSEFEKQNLRMEMTEETMNDALDDIMADSDDESEEQAVIDKVLDEIGIEISGKLADAPSAHAGTIGVKSKAPTKSSEEDQKNRSAVSGIKRMIILDYIKLQVM